jgi:hypothetical protein
MRLRFFGSILAAAGFILIQLSPSFAESRIALVIGNGAYQNVPRLANPANDAKAVAAALRRSGFDTIIATDLDEHGMEDATIRFSRAARTADVALFYYSGHALQYNGVNYLAPIEATLSDESDLRRMTRVDEIVSDLEQAKSLRIMVLDSCRDNPLAEQLRRSVGTTRSIPLGRGLAKIDTPQGMIMAYATQAGHTAEDGDGRNSPYTTAFLKHIEEQDEIGTIFREISEDVYETTKRSQLPELSLSIIGRFYLRGMAVAPTAAASASASLSPPAEKLDQSQEVLDLARALQIELRRVGCDTSAVEGGWSRTAQGAMERFNRHTGMRLDVRIASADALDVVKNKVGRVCPIACDHGYRPEGEACVKIVCDPGSHLSSDNGCERDSRGNNRRAALPRAVPSRNAPPTAEGTTGSMQRAEQAQNAGNYKMCMGALPGCYERSLKIMRADEARAWCSRKPTC